jgi:hypothetical protein
VPAKTLRVDDVAGAFFGPRQDRHAERMHVDVGIEHEGFDVTLDQFLERPALHWVGPEFVRAAAAYPPLRAE